MTVGETPTLELLRFGDPVQSVSVEVICADPLLVGDERYYAAEIVVESGFVAGRVGIQVSVEDLDEWERCLDALEAEEGAEWPAGDRTAWVEVIPDDPVEVTVQDSPSTRVAVRVPVEVGPQWVEENRARLSAVREAMARLAS
ncbi:DUF5959 family protein [Streptomyces sp. NPDC093252]|uniref:DUF5959 family protein n=1 Tax=Streptomyces sp. NPDC093252 TaxID=3154980 RepID=UPI003442A171